MKHIFFQNFDFKRQLWVALSALLALCLAFPVQAQRRGQGGGSRTEPPAQIRTQTPAAKPAQRRPARPTQPAPAKPAPPASPPVSRPVSPAARPAAPARPNNATTHNQLQQRFSAPRPNNRTRAPRTEGQNNNADRGRNNSTRSSTPPTHPANENRVPRTEDRENSTRPSTPATRSGNETRPANRGNNTDRGRRDGTQNNNDQRNRSTLSRPSTSRSLGGQSSTSNPRHNSNRHPAGARRWRSNHPQTPRHRRPNHKRPPVKIYVPVYRQSPTTRVYYYSYNTGSAFWPYSAYNSNTYYTNQNYYRYGENRQYQDNELGSFQGEVTYYGDDDWFEYKTSQKTWQVVLLHPDTIHPEEGDYVQVIGYVLDDIIYAEHVRILKSEYEYEYYED